MKLKNCPFCGFDGAYITRNECLKNGYISYGLHHTANGCILNGWNDPNVFDTEEDAMKAWNSRRTDNLERQREGIAEAKKAGKYKGRQPIAVDEYAFSKEYKAWKEGKQTATAAMSKLGLKPNTWYRRVKEYEEKMDVEA